MSDRTPSEVYTRRSLLKTGVGATALAATGATGTAVAQDSPYGGYLSDANGYAGTTAEYTDTDSVTVAVGAGDGLGFDLPAIKVPVGTTVTWEWTGEGGAHNVVANDETFNSGSTVDSSDETFEYTFEEGDEGAHTYYCNPHEGLGMKGVVVVGDNAQGEVAPASEVEYGGGGGGEEDGSEDGSGGEFDFGGFMEDANLYDGSVEDMTGQEEVTVMVGADNGFAFDPPAIQVDPGTTVTWEWTGQGGAHNVIAQDETFSSGEAVAEAGTTFEYTFEEEDTFTYFCQPHRGAGMKGAVVVGEGGSVGSSEPANAANETALQTLLAMVALGLLSPIIFLLFVRRKMGGPPRPQ